MMKAIKYLAAFTLGAAFMAATDVALENTEQVDYVTHEWKLRTVTEDIVLGEAIDGNQPETLAEERGKLEERLGVDLQEEDVIEYVYASDNMDEPLYIKLRGYDAPMEGK